MGFSARSLKRLRGTPRAAGWTTAGLLSALVVVITLARLPVFHRGLPVFWFLVPTNIGLTFVLGSFVAFPLVAGSTIAFGQFHSRRANTNWKGVVGYAVVSGALLPYAGAVWVVALGIPALVSIVFMFTWLVVVGLVWVPLTLTVGPRLAAGASFFAAFRGHYVLLKREMRPTLRASAVIIAVHSIPIVAIALAGISLFVAAVTYFFFITVIVFGYLALGLVAIAVVAGPLAFAYTRAVKAEFVAGKLEPEP